MTSRVTKRVHRVIGLLTCMTLILLGLAVAPATAIHLTGLPATYTSDADFDEGSAINVVHSVANQLQLDDTVTPFPFIWIAASARGTLIKVDTATGAIKGEYRSAPDGRGADPSRTTVDNNGNVWAGNRAESEGGMGSIVRVGLLENNQCQDRNGNGMIETSSALGDIRPWTNAAGVDNDGGVDTAADECIVHYTRTTGTLVRTLAVDTNNDVWVGGYGNRAHQKISGMSGAIVPGTTIFPPAGGYGGLLDANGILWSASLSSELLRVDTTASPPTFTTIGLGRTSYGLGRDSLGNIWQSNFCENTVQKISPAGAILGTFPTTGGTCGRGVTVTPDNHVWVANTGTNNVTRLDNAGAVVATVPVGSGPTGMAVDSDGKVWATNLFSNSASRINPATNAVDLTVDLGAGAGPYNYSDMTGSTLLGPPRVGSWSVVHDSGIIGANWGSLNWTDSTPGDSTLTVTAASSADGVTFGPVEAVSKLADLTVADGRYLKVTVAFIRATTGESPVLFDLTIADDGRNGEFSCRASAVRLGSTEPVVANPPDAPCLDDQESRPNVNLTSGLVSVSLAGLQATTDQTPDDLESAPPSTTDSGTARGRATSLTIRVGLVTVRAQVLEANAAVRCVAAPGGGLVPSLSSSSIVTGLSVNGVPVTVGTNHLDVPLLVGTLHVNHTISTPNSVTQRALWLQLGGTNVVVGEAQADFSGNPCV